jgi:hypothetical protein
MTGRVKFATSTAPRPPLADLVSNSTPPGQITRERASFVNGQLGREISVVSERSGSKGAVYAKA